MPTRRYSVGLDYNQPPAEARLYSVVPPADGTDNQRFHSDNTRVATLLVPVYSNTEGAPTAEIPHPHRMCRLGIGPDGSATFPD